MSKGLFMILIFSLVLWIPMDLVYCWFSGSQSFFAGNTHLVFIITILAGFMISAGLLMFGDWVWRHRAH
jgi:hypothetical protein